MLFESWARYFRGGSSDNKPTAIQVWPGAIWRQAIIVTNSGSFNRRKYASLDANIVWLILRRQLLF